ncbi:MAG: putative Ig domain-containing protein [Paludibacter sp.]|nr:putative Ig domain-containing protein [Paludibacter sp.]
MRKTTLFKTVLFAFILLATHTSIWADTYSYTFLAKVWSAYGDQTLSSVSWTAAATGGAYWGYDGIKGHQFGSSGSPATALSLTTSGITGTITSVKINTSGASSISGNVAISVGGTTFTSGGSTTPALTSTATDYTFTGSGNGSVSINWTQTSSKALYIKSIEITYTTAITTAPVVSATSPTGTVGTAFSYNISATNSPTSYAIASGTLPAGLTLNTTTGAITGTPTTAGSSSVTVTATNTIGTSSPATLSFTIAKGNQAITFGALDTKTSNDAPFSLTATASSGLAVSYASSNTAVATVSGSTVTIVGIGSTTITASQAGDLNYNAATSVDQTLTVNQFVAPTITVTEVTVPQFTATIGNTSTQTVHVSGVNLTSNVTLALSGANADQFSLSQSTIAQTAGTAPITAITITYTPTTEGTHTATLTSSSAGAYDITLSLSGTATWAPLSTPVATDASAITTSGFTANWNNVEGATEYQLEVYSETTGGTSLTTVFAENFDGFSAGTSGAGANGTDVSTTSIDTYTQSTGWTGSKVYQAGGTAKMGTSSVLGFLTTPTIDLSANSGNFNVSFKSMAWSTDSTRVKIYLNDVLAKTVGGLTNDLNYTLNSFSADLTGGTATSKIRFEGNQAAKGRFFLDDLVISKSGPGIVQTPVAGSPFTITDGTSKVLTGLTTGTTYKYAVTAKNAHVTSDKSNTITIATTITGINNLQVLSDITASNGTIKFPAIAGESIEIYNAVGQKLTHKLATEGTNSIQLSAHGVLLVKVGNRVAKVIL